MERQTEPISVLIIAKFAAVAIGILVVLFLVLSVLTDEAGIEEAFGAAGITKVHITGYRFLGCGLSYSLLTGYEFSTGFSGEDKSGRPVSGTVCSGFGKTAHMSFDSAKNQK